MIRWGGARFYGIGNEFMGVLVGSSIMAWALLVGKKASASRPERLASLLLFAGFITLVGAPALGTNAGGAVSAVFGFAAVWLAFYQKQSELGLGLTGLPLRRARS